MISLEWGPNGDDVFCGFSTGRLVQFSVKFSERVMIHVPLFPDQYGSDIVQLSVHKNSLLVSTLERAFVLDTETSRLSQVGGEIGVLRFGCLTLWLELRTYMYIFSK